MDIFKQPLPYSTTVLVLGILSIVTCFCYGFLGIILGIVALILAKKDLQLYHSAPESFTGYENLKAGRICAIIGLVLSSIFLFIVIIYFVFLGMMISWAELMGDF